MKKPPTSPTPSTTPTRTLRTLDAAELQTATGGARVCIQDSRGRCRWKTI